MKKYRLGKTEWIFKGQNVFRENIYKSTQMLELMCESDLKLMGATPIDEPEEEVFEEMEEFAVFDDPYLPEKGSILGKLIRNQQKLIQAVKQLQEER